MIGVNDLGPGHHHHKSSEQNIQSIVAAFLKNGIKPIVQSTLFVTNNPEINAKIETLDDALREWCANCRTSRISDFKSSARSRRQAAATLVVGRMAPPNGDAYFQWRDVIAPHATGGQP